MRMISVTTKTVPLFVSIPNTPAKMTLPQRAAAFNFCLAPMTSPLRCGGKIKLTLTIHAVQSRQGVRNGQPAQASGDGFGYLCC